MRVVVGGRILRDDDATLVQLGLAEGTVLHVVKAASSSVAAAASPSAATPLPPATSPAASAALAGVPGGAAGMRDMMNNPMMQALFENPQFMASIMEADPRMNALAEQNPEIRQMLRDPGFLRQMSRAMRNPDLMNEMMRNQDRALSNIESIPGGMAALSSMYTSMEQTERALGPTTPGTTDESNRRFAERIGANLETAGGDGPNDAALPNPWAAPASRPAPSGAGASLGAASPFAGLGGLGGAGSGGTGLGGMNPFGLPFANSASTGQTAMNGAAAGSGNPVDPPVNPFAALAGMNFGAPSAQQYQSNPGSQPNVDTRVNQMTQQLQLLQLLLQAQEQARAAANPAAAPSPAQPAFNPFATNPYAAFMPPLQPVAPAPAASVPLELAAPVVPPEERFKDQLESMSAMGFADTAKNVKALLAAGGNVDSAINYLLDMP
ncbi:hypothetical protein BC830DRAFT_1090951 [Chytriomyces sp. MP71]|nr:hypothetical protein BC830DRAFT_1090951 [Chytriomyces sp. MP71]